MGLFSYGIACALDDPPLSAPIALRGDIDRLTETAAGLGYDTIELQVKNPLQYDWARLRLAVERAGLSFSAIATGRELVENGLSLIDGDAAVRRAAVGRLKEHIDMAAAIGAMVIVGSMRASIPEPSRREYCLGLLTEAKLELAEYAAGRGVVILVENILAGISNYLNTMRQVTDYVAALGRDNVMVHLDTYSMLMEENDVRGAVEYAASRLRYVHFSDSARLFPGGGNVDFKTFLKVLHGVGYAGPIVMECVPLPDGLTCARNAIDYVSALEECIRIETSYIR